MPLSFTPPVMESLNSEGAERQVSQLSAQLEACRSVEEVQRVLGGLDTSIIISGSAEMVLRQLSGASRPERLTELVLASGSWAGPLAGWLIEEFPTSIDHFLSSTHRQVVERLSLFLTFLPYPFDRELEKQLRQFHNMVESAPKAMVDLMALSFEDTTISLHSAGEEEEEMSESGAIKIHKKRKQSGRKKQARKAKQQSQRLRLQAPQSRSELCSALQKMLDEMQVALKKYLALLQIPDIASITHGMFVVETPPLAPRDDGHNNHDFTSKVTATSESASPADHPYVQPMKAALYFENAKGFGQWRIAISGRTDRGLRDARQRDPRSFKVYIKKIKELSHGRFCADNHKRVNGVDEEIPIYEAKIADDAYLVYQIDGTSKFGSSAERQVIRVFGIYNRTQVNKQLWKSLGRQLATKGKHKPGSSPLLQRSGNEDAEVTPELPKEDLEQIHSLLVLEKFVTLSKELWISILADLDVAHVFDVTPQEMEIIEHPYSCYVLGRSGTGKTTTMMFKMLGIERAYTQELTQNAYAAKPRQLFVTQSRVLTSRVEEYFSKLLDSLGAAQKTTEEIKALAEERRLLRVEHTDLYDPNDDLTWKASLPKKFSLLRDEHFPLFLTFEKTVGSDGGYGQLVQLLEGDIETIQGRVSGHKLSGTGNGQLVDYDLFFTEYWPHLPYNPMKDTDPSLVFSEFLGVIEGSEESLNHESRRLDRLSYCNLSHRTRHVFATQRERIYDLFKAYTKRKRQRGDMDSAERTHHILKALEKTGVIGQKVDYLYVDEAQDNLLIDAMLLRSLCRNPNGLFWAGDTAQTIAIGSSFRFKDLTAFLYRLEARREARLHAAGVAQSDLQTFQLVTNYRSHGGIVRCAASVIELIAKFWPYAIDALASEQGIVDGAKPLFFAGWDTETFRYENFLSGNSGKSIEFGARQCILVRDEASRAELRERVGNIGLILTLYESKGLEFDDVLIYKFFEDSKIELGQWRVVLNLLDLPQRQGIAAPWFDEKRHAGVCAELKFLYVAITRSRKNLWIVDFSHKAQPMKVLWESMGLIETHIPGDQVVQLAESSSHEEWATTGRDLFANRRYLQAAYAFERAGMNQEEKVAKAHHLREEARLSPSSTKEGMLVRRGAFRLAARSFLDCAGQPRLGTPIERGDQVYCHNAGWCYEQAGNCGDSLEDYRCAAKAYEIAKEYDSAANLYRKGDFFDEAVQVVRNHRHKMDDELAESVFETARLFYFKGKDYSKARSMFDSDEEELAYLRGKSFLDECYADVLVRLRNFQEAAHVHARGGRIMTAIQILLGDKENEGSARLANDYILQGLWQAAPFPMKIKESNSLAIGLLSLASDNYDLLSPTQKDEVAMFKNLRTTANDTPCFRDLASKFLKRGENLHHGSDLWAVLENFLDYCRLLWETVTRLDLENEGAQKLFNFEPASGSIENGYRVPPHTWLRRQIRGARIEVVESNVRGDVVAAAGLLRALKTSLWDRLSARMLEENKHCQDLQLWTPCAPYVVNGACYRQGCLRQHVHGKDMTQGWFNDQLRGVFLQIVLYQVYCSIPGTEGYERSLGDSQRYWIHRLYETLRPSTYIMGSQACLRLKDISLHAKPALDVVESWCFDMLHILAVVDGTALSFLVEVGTLAFQFDHSKTTHYMQQAPLLGVFKDLQRYRRPLGSTGDSVCVVPEMYHCLQAADPDFITAGILFFQHVVTQRLPIDLNLICHFFEFLVGSTVLARLKFNVHLVTLPRGWFLHLLQQIHVREAQTILLDRLVCSLSQLLQDLVHGGERAGYLLFEGYDLSMRHVLREIFVSRVCRALGLLGYNIVNDNLRREILDTLKTMDTARPRPWPRSCRRFVGRHSWGGVASAVVSSYAESQLDELVQLCSLGAKSEQLRNTPVGVRRVFFESLEHALVVLAQDPPRPDVAEFAPKHKAEPDASLVVDAEESDEVGDRAIERPVADTAELVDSRDLVETLASTAAPLALESITEEQKVLPRMLLARHRRKSKSDSEEKAKTQTQRSCDSFFLTCLQLSRKMDWGERGFYKLLYLGPLPHLLTCVDVVQSYVRRAKKEIRPRMLDTSGKGIEELKNQMDDLSVTSKSSKNVRKLLDPSSALHKERNIEQLKRLVGEVGELLDRIPSSDRSRVTFDFELSTKAIVTEKKPLKPKPKPELNVEDLDDMYD